MENEQMQHAFRIAELIRLHQEQKLGMEESALLQAWLDASPRNRELVDEWDQPEIVDKYIDLYLSVTDADTVFETRIASRLQRQEEPVWQRRGYWLTGVAATVLAATLVATLWYARHQNERKPELAAVATMPASTANAVSVAIAPGRERATLTMADGHQVALDNVPVGWAALEGNTHIVKQNQGVLGYTPGQTPGNGSLNTVTTPKGGTYKVVLPDGSVAWLNAASSLRFPVAFDGKTRKVALTGEGYFEVTHDPAAPFIVHLDKSNTDIQVLGTRFDVLAYEDEPICKTTVLDGSVKVTAGTGSSGTLQKGQEAQTSGDGSFRVIRVPDAADCIAWTNDRLSLNGNITAVMRDIARWYDVTVVEYKGDVSDRTFGGSVSRDSSLTYVLKLLETTGSIHFTLDKRRIIVTP
jgi:ferric-dicitrate binding protein FerR (iron transport regulator)